jgi:hypothetical protein
MMNSLFSIIGLLLAAIFLLYHYRSTFLLFKNDLKGSLMIATSIIFLLFIFYLFFKTKGF